MPAAAFATFRCARIFDVNRHGLRVLSGRHLPKRRYESAPHRRALYGAAPKQHLAPLGPGNRHRCLKEAL